MRAKTVYFRIIPLVVWTLTVLVLSLESSPPHFDFALASWDKFQHAAAYAMLTALAGYAFLPYCRRPATAWLMAFLVAVVYGGLLEIAQGTFTAVRTPDWRDLAADAVGAAVVVVAARLLAFRFRARP